MNFPITFHAILKELLILFISGVFAGYFVGLLYQKILENLFSTKKEHEGHLKRRTIHVTSAINLIFFGTCLLFFFGPLFLIMIPFSAFPILISQIYFFFSSAENKTFENYFNIITCATTSAFWGSIFAIIIHFVLYAIYIGISDWFDFIMFVFFTFYLILLSSISGGIAGCQIEKARQDSKK